MNYSKDNASPVSNSVSGASISVTDITDATNNDDAKSDTVNTISNTTDADVDINDSFLDIEQQQNISLDNSSSSSVYKFKPKYLNTNFSFEMMAATVTNDEHNFKNIGNFRTRNDMCGMSWETVDQISHPELRYPTNCDFTNVMLQYDYNISGYTASMDSTISPTLTIETNDGGIYFVRLWNCVTNRPFDEWEIGASSYFETDISFPENRTPGSANGTYGTIEIDFNNLYSGWTPYYWTKHLDDYDEDGNSIYSDEWVANPGWVKVPINNIKKITWIFVPTDYSYQTGNVSYLSNSYEYEVNFSNWYVTGNSYLGEEPSAKELQSIRICDDYDDIYNMTPERVADEYFKLGYGGIVNFYIGASHYYDKKYNGNRMETITSYPFNHAFEKWYQDYLRRLKANNTEVINSISMESVDAPESWWQRAWDGTPATTNWTPVPHLLSFVNYNVKMFYQSYVRNLARLSVEQGMEPKIQLGEPWWWYIDNGIQKIPCFYDSATRYQFNAEMGYPIYEFKTCDDSIEGHEDVLYWLRDKNGEFTLFLRDSVKQMYPSTQFSILFFPPSVMDKDRISMMMSIVNFPKDQWKYPNLDFFMLEDYDYLIEDKMDKHQDALTFVQKNLGYPENKIHYFAGFVLNEQYNNVWTNINQAINDGFNQGFVETYIWAYAQVKRDGWVQPEIILADKKPGNYSGSIDVSLSCNGADPIRYTTDGTEPGLYNGAVYSTPIPIETSTTVKAVAVKNGSLSSVMNFNYTIPLKEPLNINLKIDGTVGEWRSLSSLCIGSGKIFDLTAAQDEYQLYLLARGSNMDTTSNFYIDTDMSSSSGYNVWAWNDSGADYLVEDSILYRYSGTGSDWKWTRIGSADIEKTSSSVEAAVNLMDLGITYNKEIMVAYCRNYEDFAPIVGSKMVAANTMIAKHDLDGNNYNSATNIRIEKEYFRAVDGAGDVDYFKFKVPEVSGDYDVTIQTFGETDTIGELYDSSGTNILTEDDDTGAGTNFLISAKLESGQNYYIAVYNFDADCEDGDYILIVNHKPFDENAVYFQALMYELGADYIYLNDGSYEITIDGVTKIIGQDCIWQEYGDWFVDVNLFMEEFYGTEAVAMDSQADNMSKVDVTTESIAVDGDLPFAHSIQLQAKNNKVILSNVIKLQKVLNVLSCYNVYYNFNPRGITINFTGIYNKGTENAVKLFQSRYMINKTVTGTCDEETAVELSKYYDMLVTFDNYSVKASGVNASQYLNKVYGYSASDISYGSDSYGKYISINNQNRHYINWTNVNLGGNKGYKKFAKICDIEAVLIPYAFSYLGRQLLIDLELWEDSTLDVKYFVYNANGNISGIRAYEVEETGVTLGFGSYTAYDNIDGMNILSVKYEITDNLTDAELFEIIIPYQDCIDMMDAYIEENMPALLDDFLYYYHINVTPQEFDMLIIYRYLNYRLTLEMQDLLRANNRSREDWFDALMEEIPEGSIFYNGWLNRTLEELELFFDGDYTRNR
ncbi:MAG: non-contractile tail sheath protein [Mobilitalea sp.]